MTSAPVILIRPRQPKVATLDIQPSVATYLDSIGPWATRTVFPLPIATNVLVAPADSTRRRIGFAALNAGAQLDNYPMDVAGTTGILIPPSGVLWFKHNDAGQLTTFDWYALNPGAPTFNLIVYQLFDW